MGNRGMFKGGLQGFQYEGQGRSVFRANLRKDKLESISQIMGYKEGVLTRVMNNSLLETR